MNGIFKVPQHTGEKGRPKGVEVLGANRKEKGDPEIVGARKPGEPKIMDRTTRTEEKGEAR